MVVLLCFQNQSYTQYNVCVISEQNEVSGKNCACDLTCSLTILEIICKSSNTTSIGIWIHNWVSLIGAGVGMSIHTDCGRIPHGCNLLSVVLY